MIHVSNFIAQFAHSIVLLTKSRCSVAVASGVNMILSAGTYIGFCQARMLSPDGSCKTFDEAANGNQRS